MSRPRISIATLCALACVLALAACGSAGRATHARSSACRPPDNPPQMGEALRHQLCVEGKLTSAPPIKATGKLCYDVSIWQGPDPSLAGVSCLIIQTNDGLWRSNPYFGSQVLDARRHHIPWGSYTFLSGAPGAQQAALALAVANGWGRTLGVWADAEVGEAYPQTCAFVRAARTGSHIVGVYSAPGIYAGGYCGGFLWPAEWSASAPYAFGGWSDSAIRLWQFCGTCSIDRDSPRNGFLAPRCGAVCRRDRKLRAQIAKREVIERNSRANERRDRSLIARYRRERPGCISPRRTPKRCARKAAIKRQIQRLEGDLRYLRARVRESQRLIAHWRSELR